MINNDYRTAVYASQKVDFNRYELGSHNVRRVPKMTDEQVQLANQTRKLPDGFSLMTKERNEHRRNGSLKYTTALYDSEFKTSNFRKPMMTVIKGEKNYSIKDNPNYYDTLPDGYELDNTKLGTFLKKSNVKHTLFNYYQAPIYMVIGAMCATLVTQIWKLKK